MEFTVSLDNVRRVGDRSWEITVAVDPGETILLDISVRGFRDDIPMELTPEHHLTVAEVRADLVPLKRMYIERITEYRTQHLGEFGDPYAALSEFDADELENIKQNGINPTLLGYGNYLEVQRWYASFRLLSIGLEFWYDEHGLSNGNSMWGIVKDPTGRNWIAVLGSHGNPKYETGDGCIECCP
jgi:hypothetical protein